VKVPRSLSPSLDSKSRRAFRFEERTLGNGLRVLLIPRPGLHQAAVSMFLRTGSRYESKADNGLSHFLEHMLVRGSGPLKTAHEVALAFERLGETLYAATATDHGLMSVALPAESLPTAIGLLGQVVKKPVFSAIEVERRIVHEEILEDLDDDGRDINADNIARALLFGDHPLGRPITGPPEHLEGFDVARLRGHLKRHYTANNAVVAVSGAFDERTILDALEGAFGSLAKGKRLVPEAAPAVEVGARPRVSFVESDGSQTDLRVAFRAPGDHHPREAATEMLLRVLDDGMSTRLYERICDRLGLCYTVSAGFEAYEDAGVFDFAAETQHGRVTEVTEQMLNVCAELAAHGPTAAELDKAKSRAAWGIRALLDSPGDLADFYGLATLAEVARTPAERADQLLSVSAEEVRAAAEEVFQPSQLAAVAVGLLPKKVERSWEKLVGSFGR
jgi:predicted Zn-dependent peptidase